MFDLLLGELLSHLLIAKMLSLEFALWILTGDSFPTTFISKKFHFDKIKWINYINNHYSI